MEESRMATEAERPVKVSKINSNDIALIKAFAANANNHLMNLSVSGDDILKSAKLMQDAHEIIKILSEGE